MRLTSIGVLANLRALGPEKSGSGANRTVGPIWAVAKGMKSGAGEGQHGGNFPLSAPGPLLPLLSPSNRAAIWEARHA